jgi:Inactivated superfamily I helicase
MTSFHQQPGFHFIPFAQSLLAETAALLQALEHHSRDAYLETLVLLPTRRAVKELKAILQGHKAAVVFPRIMAVKDLTVPQFETMPAPQTISDFQRLGLILNVLKMLAKQGAMLEAPSLAFAGRLAQFLDDIATFEIDTDQLTTLVPDELALHWQKTLDFLIPFFNAYRDALHQGHLEDHATKRIRTFRTLIHHWRQSPPETPIICAGIDGFIPALFDLSHFVATLPTGYVLCSHATNFTDAPLKPTHPDALGQKLNLSRPRAQDARTHLMTQVFADQGASVAEQDALGDNTPIENLFICEADTTCKEALYAALLTRKALAEHPESGNIAVISPDPDLSLKIQEELTRWGITADLASGMPLTSHRLGQLALDVLRCAQTPQNCLTLFTAFKNPYVCFNYPDYKAYQFALRAYETACRRTGRILHTLLDEAKPNADAEAIPPFIETFKTLLAPLMKQPKHPLTYWLENHLHVLQALVAPKSLFVQEAGQALKEIFQTFAETAAYFPNMSLSEYHDLIQKALADTMLRNPLSHKRVRILNPIQALYAPKDVAILVGLNEGTWPAAPPTNPWLNREMALKLGLFDPQILIGQGASLFAGCLANGKSYLLYAKQKDGSPLSPSRFILRLKAYAALTGQTQHLEADIGLDALGKALDKAELERAVTRISEPKPAPLLTQRPLRLSVSDLEMLLKNPYHICAKHIYELHCLPSLAQMDAQQNYGSFVHQVLEAAGPAVPATAQEFMTLAHTLLPADLTPPLQFKWLAQLQKNLAWILDFLQQRQTHAVTSLYEHRMSHKFSLNGLLIEIVGKADRIDRLTDGTTVLMDYKTGRVPSMKAVKTFQAPQLSLLAWLYEKTAGQTVHTLSYVDLGHEKIISVAKQDIDVNIDTILRDLLLPYYTDAASPYRISPTESLGNPFNAYRHLERTEEWLENMH